jgi:hypothetical protein
MGKEAVSINSSKKISAKKIILQFILIAVSAVCFVKLYSYIKEDFLREDNLKTKGVIAQIAPQVTDGKTKRIPYVTFTTIHNERRSFYGDVDMPNAKPGDTVAVYYNPLDPSQAAVYSGGIVFYAFVISFASALLALLPFAAVIIPLHIMRRNGDANIMRSKWRARQGAVVKITASVKAPGMAVFELQTRDGEIFKSFYPIANYNIKKGDVFNVYIHPKNPKKYMVDILEDK